MELHAGHAVYLNYVTLGGLASSCGLPANTLKLSPSSSSPSSKCACETWMIGDGKCDKLCVTPGCSYDAGDCDDEFPTRQDFTEVIAGVVKQVDASDPCLADGEVECRVFFHDLHSIDATTASHSRRLLSAHSRRFLATASSVNFSRVQAARSQTDHGSPFSRGPRRRLLQMDCAAGEVRNVDSDTCMQCPVGQFSSAGDTICSDCAPGKCKCQQRARVSGIERHERADNGLCAGFGCQVVVSLIKEWTKALRGCKAESLPECQ